MSLLWASVTHLSNEDVPHEAVMRNNGADVGQTALLLQKLYQSVNMTISYFDYTEG